VLSGQGHEGPVTGGIEIGPQFGKIIVDVIRSDLQLAARPVGYCRRFVFIVATVACMTFGTPSPRYIMQHAKSSPWRGTHDANMAAGTKTLFVTTATDSCTW
jgi:hypothetical protein